MGEIINGRAIERNYPVGAGPGPVQLTIVIGDGQIGGSAVWIDTTLVASGTVQHFVLGSPAMLRGHAVGIRTIVADVNPQTNHTSVTYILTGGSVPADLTLTFDAPHDKDAVPYVALFHFV
ncbi:MAG: hypothetical protein JWO56_3351 [Acidobacteria bacterium]|nr:hypothetical protein [Acidobacteriota bacterium]